MADAYYNENDAFAAAWLRNLISAGHIAPGEVDTRSIVDVRPDDVRGFGQCHFFAGIGVWSHALRYAGWRDDRAVWTGSCPCQPFSNAGKRAGIADDRHLWPEFFRLIGECRPGVVLGEQVASQAGLGWIDLVQADLENAGYAFGAIDLCAAGLGAPHIRQRLYWVADAENQRHPRSAGESDPRASVELERSGPAGLLADAGGARLPVCEPAELRGSGRRREGRAAEQRGGASGWMGHADSAGCGPRDSVTGRDEPRPEQPENPGSSDALADAGNGQLSQPERGPQGRDGNGPDRANAAAGPTNGYWRDADWLLCRDDKWRPVEPGTFPLAHGAAARVGRLRGYGNAIVAPVAQAFIEAVMECIP